ncbi:MAG: OmpA family protein [Dechloromonas sp.]|nr:MAG: OmpA family protein [Dechloromonas sp.]
MKTRIVMPAMLVIATLLAACTSMPRTTSLLDQTHVEYRMAQNNPDVGRYAPLELKQAGEAMALANAAAANHESTDSIDQLAYLARQKVALTQEVAKRKAAESDVANSERTRDQMRLTQRTNEADRAHQATDTARLATDAARRDTADANARISSLESQLADLAAKKTERGMVITLGDVLFATDQYRLNEQGQSTIRKLSQFLQQHPARNVLIEGFTDSTGSTAHNQQLSERRAAAVARSLSDQGIARRRIETRGYGQEYPVASNATTAERQLNRRVEIVLSEDGGKIRPR